MNENILTSWVGASLVVALAGVMLPACGGGGSLKEVQGAHFAMNAAQTSLADRYEQFEPQSTATPCDYWHNTVGLLDFQAILRNKGDQEWVKKWAEAKRVRSSAVE